ncbi:MAG TPA: hypothetical protein VHY08_00910 [Bacillota bacterium]|nr:hypothetical protein [Bacillota bacterium]
MVSQWNSFRRRLTIGILLISFQLVCFIHFTNAEGMGMAEGRQWEYTVFDNKELYAYLKFTVAGQEQWQGQTTWVIKGQFKTCGVMLKGHESEMRLRVTLDYRLLYIESRGNPEGSGNAYLFQWKEAKGYVAQYQQGDQVWEEQIPAPAPVYLLWTDTTPFIIELLLQEGRIGYYQPFSVFMTDGIRTVTPNPKESMKLKTPRGTEVVDVCEIPEIKTIAYLNVEKRLVALEDYGTQQMFYPGNWVKKGK